MCVYVETAQIAPVVLGIMKWYVYYSCSHLHGMQAGMYVYIYILRHMELVDGWQDGKEGAKLAMILEQAYIDQGVGRELERMWRSRFEKRPASQSPSEL